MKKIGWFTTARGPGSYNLFTAMLNGIKKGEIDAKLSFVFINRDIKGNQYRMKLVKDAEDNGVPVIIFPSDSFMPDLKQADISAWRDAYGQGLRDRISKYEMDFGVLAGYMLIFDRETCRQYTMINLHPALPDTYKGTWEEIIGSVVENGDEKYGATVHLCTRELDRGEPIAYDSFSLDKFKVEVSGQGRAHEGDPGCGIEERGILAHGGSQDDSGRRGRVEGWKGPQSAGQPHVGLSQPGTEHRCASDEGLNPAGMGYPTARIATP